MSLSLRSGFDPWFVKGWKAWRPFEGSHGFDVDVKETNDKLEIVAECPGLKREDIKVDMLDDRTLRIRGEKREESERNDEMMHIKERKYGKFERIMQMPNNVNTDNIMAKFDNGILRVEMKKNPGKIEGGRAVPLSSGAEQGRQVDQGEQSRMQGDQSRTESSESRMPQGQEERAKQQ